MEPGRRIKLGISSCLQGNNVRYDGGNRLDRNLLGNFGASVEWVPVCPEVECGLPAPREAMQLVLHGDMLRLMTITSGIDRTDRLLQWAEGKLAGLAREGLSGFVFKARSPSCAVRDALFVFPDGSEAGRGPGLFSAAFVRHFPRLPVAEEEGLRNPAALKRFLDRATGCCS